MATANPARAYPVQPRIGYSGGGRLGAVIDTLGWGFPQTKTVFGSAQPHLYYILSTTTVDYVWFDRRDDAHTRNAN